QESLIGHDPVPAKVCDCVGGVSSPLLANIYLNEVDAMLERAKATTRNGGFTQVEYARYADDLVILVNGYWRNAWLLSGEPAAPRGIRQARSHAERREEPDRGPDEGGDVWVLGLHYPPRAVAAREVVAEAHAVREAADGAAEEAQGRVPASTIP